MKFGSAYQVSIPFSMVYRVIVSTILSILAAKDLISHREEEYIYPLTS